MVEIKNKFLNPKLAAGIGAIYISVRLGLGFGDKSLENIECKANTRFLNLMDIYQRNSKFQLIDEFDICKAAKTIENTNFVSNHVRKTKTIARLEDCRCI